MARQINNTLALGWLLFAAVSLVACDRCDDPPPPVPGAASSSAPAAGSIEQARAHLQRFLEPGADQAALWRELAPRDEDYAKVFVGEAVTKARAYYADVWKQTDGEGVKKVRKDEQTELLLWAASGTQLDRMEGDASHFPGQYGRIAHQLNPDLVFYAFRFQEPGASWGMSFDGLVFVNDRWVIFHKPWRALRDRPDGGEAQREGDAAAAGGGRPADAPKRGAAGAAGHSSGGGS